STHSLAPLVCGQKLTESRNARAGCQIEWGVIRPSHSPPFSRAQIEAREACYTVGCYSQQRVANTRLLLIERQLDLVPSEGPLIHDQRKFHAEVGPGYRTVPERDLAAHRFDDRIADR